MMGDILVIFLASIVLYVANAARGLYPGDAGDLVTAAVTGGIPHPPGYPLYTALGWLVTRLPVSTPAFRMAWLSFLPHATTLILVYLLAYRLTKRRIAGVFSVAFLAGNYLFFLYSVTPEVFALLDLFVISLFYLSVLLKDRFTAQRFYLLCLIIGLSFAHHPLVVLIIPSIFLLVRHGIQKFRWTIPRLLSACGLFAFGLVPYGYIYIAARGRSVVNWDRPTTLSRFIELITRADYGSFMSGASVGPTWYTRFLNVKVLFTFLLNDFTWIGIVLIVFGLLWLWRRNRTFVYAFGISVMLFGPVFSFYANFSIVNRFVLATVERFMLPMYVLLAPLLGIGVVALEAWLRLRIKQLSVLFVLVMFLYPGLVMGMNIWRFWGFTNDYTTDRYAKDVLDSAPLHSIVLLSRDTPLFSVQYLRYVFGYRSDTIPLHTSRLVASDYHEVLHQLDPNIRFPSSSSALEAYLTTFIHENHGAYTIASNTRIPLVDGDGVWIPHGLLYVLTPTKVLPDPKVILSENATLWRSYGNPQSGILSHYRHLFLTNVLDEYAIPALSYGSYLLKNNDVEDAIVVLKRTISYGSDTQTPTAWMYLGLAQSLSKHCSAALADYDKATPPGISQSSVLLYYRAVTYRDCVGDTKRANEFFARYQEANRESEQPLQAPREVQ